MNNIWHVVGPPGTGKTRYLTDQAKNAAGKYGGKSTLLCSLTKAAAREMAGRNTAIDESMIGTLHAHAFRALGEPAIAEAHIKDWNEEYPHMLLSDKSAPDKSGATDSDILLGEINNLRAGMIPEEQWPRRSDFRFFLNKWLDWKSNHCLQDFTDIIECAIYNVPVHPAKPDVLLGDEAQDWSKLEAKLFRDVWGSHANTIVMAGDEDQTLYSWRGADPHIFTDHPTENTKVLEQSYRVPSEVHKTAQRWIRQIKDRFDAVYAPKEGAAGEVNQLHNICYRDPSNLIRKLEDHNDDSVMILCSCDYMLKSIIKELRANGIPFHNPYRVAQGAWNPLSHRRDTISSIERLMAFTKPEHYNMQRWNKEQFQKWYCLLDSKILVRGSKAIVESGDFKMPSTGDEWAYYLKNEEDVLPMMNLDTSWLYSNLLKSNQRKMEYALKVSERSSQPLTINVIVGTIHSVKGGEADHVYLFPDVSYQAMQGDMDPLIRMFYVGMTRAKQTLNLCEPSGRMAVEWL